MSELEYNLEALKADFPKTTLFTKTQTAKAINRSEATIDRLRKSGDLVSKKIGGHVMFHVTEIARFMAR